MLAQASCDPRIIPRQRGLAHVATSMGYIATEDAEAIEKVQALSERKVVALLPDAGHHHRPRSRLGLQTKQIETTNG
jgi:hypothetical protein